jgi:hypothetical protein
VHLRAGEEQFLGRSWKPSRLGTGTLGVGGQ